MAKRYSHHALTILVLLLMAYWIVKPLNLQSAPLDETPHITFDTDWENLIGINFNAYKLKFSHALTKIDNNINSPYNIYQYQNSLLFICKESNIIHHVSVRDSNIMICNTYVGMSLHDIKEQHGKATVSQETLATKEWILQYTYDYVDNYNLATRCLTYSLKNYNLPVKEITYGYTLPLFPTQVGTIGSLKSARKYLQGQWRSSNSKQLILYNQYLLEQFPSPSHPQSYKNFFVLSPNEIFIAHHYRNTVTSLTPLRFIFNQDYNKVFFFSTDQHGIPIESSIDVWTRSP